MYHGTPGPEPIRSNINVVARLEQQFLDQRTFVERLGDTIADFVGTMSFVLLHLVGCAVWIALNLGVVPVIKPFDPFPFVLFTLIVSFEGVLMSTFVLMKQNRMSRRADQRDHLNLQIDLLAEKEITKILELQRMLCAKLGIDAAERDAEAQQLSRHTAVEDLAKELEQKLPES